MNVFVACKRYGERLQVDSHQSIDNKSNYSRRIFFRFEFDNGNDVSGVCQIINLTDCIPKMDKDERGTRFKCNRSVREVRLFYHTYIT